MTNPFSALELSLVKSSLATRTNQEIADILERSVDEVIEMINELTDGAAQERQSDVHRYKEEKLQQMQNEARKRHAANVPDEYREKEKPKKAPRIKDVQRHKKESELKENQKRFEAEKQWANQRTQTRNREARRTFKTREIDLSKMISVKLDHKTTVFIEPLATKELTELKIKEVRATYSILRDKSKLEIDLR